jgi:hypothetical protein
MSRLDKPYEIVPRKSIFGSEATMPKIKQKLRNKLQRLAQMSIATNCEAVRFSAFIHGSEGQITQDFGELRDKPEVEIEVTISENTLRLLVDGDELVTWNHLDIGYLSSWSRSPEIYPVKFMQLLQLGYVTDLSSTDQIDELKVGGTAVSDILEHNPDMALRIFGRAGLQCASRDYSRSESLEAAIRIHGIGPRQASVRVAEVNALLGSR